MPSSPGLMGKLKGLDAFPKVNEDFFTKTMSGGVITIASSIVMILLFLSELRLFTSIRTHHELSVDTSRGETIKIHFNVTFPHMPCSWLSLDTMDVSGELHLDLDHDVYRQRLDSNGKSVRQVEKHDVQSTKAVAPTGNGTCGDCYGAGDTETACCNTCDEVRAAYRRRGWALANVDRIEQCKHDSYMDSVRQQAGEGCKMWGHVEVNKVAGNFHFAPGRSYQQGGMHVHDVAPFGDATMDFTHTIHTLSFGTPYPGMKNPLDGVKMTRPGVGTSGMYQYFLKVVPTTYTSITGRTNISTNQYSVTENYRDSKPGAGMPASGNALPGVFFFYDLSPIKVKITEGRTSFLHFMTSICAIVGGVFTVAGVVDAVLYQGGRLIRKKRELGKFS